MNLQNSSLISHVFVDGDLSFVGTVTSFCSEVQPGGMFTLIQTREAEITTPELKGPLHRLH